MNSRLQNQRAFVTGGSRGIGAAIVRRLAREGARVIFTYSASPDQAAGVVRAVAAAGGQARAVQVDSGDAAALVAALDRAAAELGGLDLLVNNAGVKALGPIESITLADFDRALAVNVRAVFVASQAVLRHLPDGGRIINIGSTNADRMPFPGGAVYAMSKSALQGFVQGLARDLGPRGITVNNIQPGPVDTDFNPADSEFADVLRNQFVALKRYAQADEIAGMVAYVASPEAAYVTGANLTIDGGFSA